VPVELAMRYQNPSIPDVVKRLADRGVAELLVIPLFPHYAMSSYESAVERIREIAGRVASGMRLQVEPPYFDTPDYIKALTASAEEYLKTGYDHLLFSFHGVPERQIRKSDPTGRHCLTVNDCCHVSSEAHKFCYRHQCFRTAEEFVRVAGVPAGKWSVSFQSRLGKDPWLKPYTDFELPRLAQEGKKKMLVICAAFVSDCLETIEEIGMRGKETFLEAGGEDLKLIPCMNEHPLWIEALEKMVSQFVAASR
jgi:ferrochelatase